MDCFNQFIYIVRRNVINPAPVLQNTPNGYQVQIKGVGIGTEIWAIEMAEFVPLSSFLTPLQHLHLVLSKPLLKPLLKPLSKFPLPDRTGL